MSGPAPLLCDHPDMPTRLTDMVVDEVSFVKRGANQDAHIVLFKGCAHASMEDGDKTCPECGIDASMVKKGAPSATDVHVDKPSKRKKGDGTEEDEDDLGTPYVQPPAGGVPSSPPKAKDEPKPTPPPVAQQPPGAEAQPPEESYDETDEDEDEEKPMLKSELPEVLQKHLEGEDDSEVTPEVLAVAVEAANAEAAETAITEASVEKAAEEEGLPTEIAKADPEIQALWKSQQDQITAATEIAKAERDARLTKEFTEVAKTFTNLPAVTEDFGVVLKGLHEVDPDIYEQVVTVLRGANEAANSIYKSFGSSPVGDQSGSSLSAIEKAAVVIKTENPALSEAEAQDIAMQRDPSLYAQYIAETQGA